MSGQVVHTIENTNGSVTGIAVLDDRMYVSYYNTLQIAVYCPTTYQCQSHLSTICQKCGTQTNEFQCRPCMYSYYRYHCQTQIRDMVGCGVNNCLYASIHNINSIHKVALGQNNTLSSWSIDSSPHGLSVTSSHNLLVAVSGANALYEYSTDGVAIRQINLQPAGISAPVYAVQLSNDHYAVVHHGPTHQFSVISSDGQLVQSYRGDAGNMNEPRAVAVDQAGRVFVADQGNHRILVMCCKNLSAYPLPLPTECQLDGPCSIYYDSSNRHLYIGEWNGGRIICCKL